MSESLHISVLLDEAIAGLEPQSGGFYVDGTLGGGGHTAELLRVSAPSGTVYSFDIDPTALERARNRFAREEKTGRWQGIEDNFADWEQVLLARDAPMVDGMLLDLGFSTDELENPTIGLSFLREGVLDMRFGEKANKDGMTAAHIVNQWTLQEIDKLLRVYGEERYSRRIASAILEARKTHLIVQTIELAQVIEAAVPGGYERGRIHPATRTFQALRMAVNEELPHLEQAIAGAWNVLKPGGRLAIISFHSLEDRVVKLAFQKDGWEPLTKRPIVASEQECVQNPRARSAKLRVAEKRG